MQLTINPCNPSSYDATLPLRDLALADASIDRIVGLSCWVVYTTFAPHLSLHPSLPQSLTPPQIRILLHSRPPAWRPCPLEQLLSLAFWQQGHQVHLPVAAWHPLQLPVKPYDPVAAVCLL